MASCAASDRKEGFATATWATPCAISAASPSTPMPPRTKQNLGATHGLGFVFAIAPTTLRFDNRHKHPAKRKRENGNPSARKTDNSNNEPNTDAWIPHMQTTCGDTSKCNE